MVKIKEVYGFMILIKKFVKLVYEDKEAEIEGCLSLRSFKYPGELIGIRTLKINLKIFIFHLLLQTKQKLPIEQIRTNYTKFVSVLYICNI